MDTTSKTIFLVDDNRSNLVVGKKALSPSYNVFTIISGKRMFSALEKIIPDLILLDVEMPEMSGYEVLEKLKENSNYADIPVIFLTALSGDDTELKGLSMGAVDFIAKPFSPALLLKRIELHLKLVDYSNNLENMVAETTAEVVALKNAVLKTTAELVEHRDKTTGNHIERTQKYLKILLEAANNYSVYSDEINSLDIELVLQSSQLHDVGKVKIRDNILLKPERLTSEEYEEMKTHTTFGESIINNIKENTTDSNFLEYARIFALSHHEKWDGTGYPYGLSGENIPLLGRLMAIVDVYDALVTDRPYKKAYSHDEAALIIEEGKATHFDPVLIEVFLKIHNEFRKYN